MLRVLNILSAFPCRKNPGYLFSSPLSLAIPQHFSFLSVACLLAKSPQELRLAKKMRNSDDCRVMFPPPPHFLEVLGAMAGAGQCCAEVDNQSLSLGGEEAGGMPSLHRVLVAQ